MLTSQIKPYCKNSKFVRGAYLATYEINTKPDEISEFPSKFMDVYGKVIFAIPFLAKVH